MISPERFTQIQTSAVATGSWYGPLVTAHSTIHTKGSWTSLIATANFDAFLCGVMIGEVAVVNTLTSMLVDIGIDPAGGTSYTVEIPNILAGGAPTSNLGTPATLWFPVSIPKGSQIAARCQALITVDTAQVGVVLIGGKNRSNPFPHRGRIQDYGTNTATSGGTLGTSGTTDTKGTWTQLGADTTRRHSGLVVAATLNDNAVTAGRRYLIDVGMDPAGGTSYGVILPDIPGSTNTSETAYLASPLTSMLALDIPAGAALAFRSAEAAGVSGDLQLAVYGF